MLSHISCCDVQVTVTVPTLSFTVRLPTYTPATFNSTVRQLYRAALQAASPTGGWYLYSA